MAVEMRTDSEIALPVWLPVVALITLAGVISILVIQYLEVIEAFVAESGPIGPMVSVGLQAVLGASPIPGEPITVINGAVFGPVKGAALSWVGYMVAAYVEYGIGKRVDNTAEFDLTQLPEWLQRFSAESPVFLVGARLIPGYGPKIVGLLAGMYRVPLWRYTWTTAIPTFVGALIFALGGTGLHLLSL